MVTIQGQNSRSHFGFFTELVPMDLSFKTEFTGHFHSFLSNYMSDILEQVFICYKMTKKLGNPK
jgi:hypothetical protein